MTKDWVSHFSLKGDPFDTKALENEDDFGRFFVKTDDIVRRIDPILHHFVDSAPKVIVIGGERGIGKSTALHYIYNTLSRSDDILTAYCDMRSVRVSYQHEQYGFGGDLIHQIIYQILVSLKAKNPDFVDMHRGALRRIAETVNFDLDSEKHTIIETKDHTYNVLANRLGDLCALLKTFKARLLIEFDNFDITDAEFALKFLRRTYSQALFDVLEQAGGTIVFAVGKETLSRIKADEDFSFLGTPIQLAALNPLECKTIVLKRIQDKLKDLGRNAEGLFEPKALTSICTSPRVAGIPRRVLALAQSCMMGAADQSESIVTDEIARSVIEEESLGEANFYTIVEGREPAKMAFQRLLEFQDETDFATFTSTLKSIVRLYKRLNVSEAELDDARKQKFVTVRSSNSLQSRFVLDQNIEELLRLLEKRRALERFIQWISRDKPETFAIPSPKTTNKQNEIRDLFMTLLDSLGDEDIRKKTDEASAAYDSLAQNTVGTWDLRIVSGRMLTVLDSCAQVALMLHGRVDKKQKRVAPADDSTLKDFVINEFPSLCAEWSMIVGYCDAVKRGSTCNEETIKQQLIIADKTTDGMLRYSRKRIIQAAELNRPKIVNTASLQEIGNLLVRYAGFNDKPSFNEFPPRRYFIARYLDRNLAEFMVVGWSSRGNVLGHRYGEKVTQDEDEGTKHHQTKFQEAFLPNFMPRELRDLAQGLQHQYSIRFYQSLELSEFFTSLAKRKPIEVKFFSDNETAKVDLKVNEGPRYSASLMQLPASYGEPFKTVQPVVATSPADTMTDPDTPYENILKMKRVFGRLTGHIMVADRYFDEKALIVLRYLDFHKIQSLRVLMGDEHLQKGNNLRFETNAFVSERSSQNVPVEFRVADESDTEELHARYVFSDNAGYSLPSLGAFNTKLDEINELKSEELPLRKGKIENYWKRATLLSNYTKKDINKQKALAKNLKAQEELFLICQQLGSRVERAQRTLQTLPELKNLIQNIRYRERVRSFRNNEVDSLREECKKAIEKVSLILKEGGSVANQETKAKLEEKLEYLKQTGSSIEKIDSEIANMLE